MNLSVKNLSSGTVNSYQRQDNNKNNRIYMTANNDKLDLSCNKKFNFREAMKNFGQGLVSPITGMFSSGKNFLIGAGTIVGSTALILATGGAAAPIFVALGASLGVIQAGKAAIKMAKAQNGDDVEKAFYDVGSATSTIGFSLWGAKPSLKQASIQTEGLNSFNAVKTCFTSIEKLASESMQVFKSGYFKTNFTNGIKLLMEPKSLRKYSKELRKEGKKTFEESFGALKNILPDKFKSCLKGRSKCELSIYEKMVKERTVIIQEKIKKIKNNNNYSEEIKRAKIKKLYIERSKIKNDGDFAKSKIEDLRGARITLDNIKASDMEELVSAIAKAVKNGDLELIEIENYRGFNKKYGTQNQFYLSEKQVEKLKDISGKTIIKNATKPSGYTAAQLKVKPKGGQLLELQIRGKYVDEFADAEHITYDLRQGKDIAKGNNKAGILLAKVQKAIKGLSGQKYTEYQKYIYDNYMYAQRKELGLSAEAPKLPEGIDQILSVENLKDLSKQTSEFKSGGIKNIFGAFSQVPLFFGVEDLSA